MSDRRSNIVFVGQAPSRSTRGLPPLSGRSGRRLASLLGVDESELRRRYVLVNLLDGWPGKGDSDHPQGDRFPMSAARTAARKMIPKLVGCRVVMCGKNVRDAFGLGREFFEISDARLSIGDKMFEYCVIPHPSGVSRFWNDPENVDKVRRFLRSFVEKGRA